MSNLTYQKYRNKDLDTACKLIISHRLYTPGTGAIRDTVLFKDTDLIIIAFKDEKPIACIVRDAMPSSYFDDERFAVNVWVKPSYRKKGIGKELINLMKKSSRKKIFGYGSKAGLKFYPKSSLDLVEYL